MALDQSGLSDLLDGLQSIASTAGGRPLVLMELGLVEQRYKAVLEVSNDGATVTDVAVRYGVAPLWE